MTYNEYRERWNRLIAEERYMEAEALRADYPEHARKLKRETLEIRAGYVSPAEKVA
jgi:hypothetical protein